MEARPNDGGRSLFNECRSARSRPHGLSRLRVLRSSRGRSSIRWRAGACGLSREIVSAPGSIPLSPRRYPGAPEKVLRISFISKRIQSPETTTAQLLYGPVVSTGCYPLPRSKQHGSGTTTFMDDWDGVSNNGSSVPDLTFSRVRLDSHMAHPGGGMAHPGGGDVGDTTHS